MASTSLDPQATHVSVSILWQTMTKQDLFQNLDAVLGGGTVFSLTAIVLLRCAVARGGASAVVIGGQVVIASNGRVVLDLRHVATIIAKEVVASAV